MVLVCALLYIDLLAPALIPRLLRHHRYPYMVLVCALLYLDL